MSSPREKHGRSSMADYHSDGVRSPPLKRPLRQSNTQTQTEQKSTSPIDPNMETAEDELKTDAPVAFNPSEPATWPLAQACALWRSRQEQGDPTPVILARNVPPDVFASLNLSGLRLDFNHGDVVVRTVPHFPHEYAVGECSTVIIGSRQQHGGIRDGRAGAVGPNPLNKKEPDFQIHVLDRAVARGGRACPTVVGEISVSNPPHNHASIRERVSWYFNSGPVMKVLMLLFFPHNNGTNSDPMLYLEFDPYPHALAPAAPYPHVRAVSFGTGPLPALDFPLNLAADPAAGRPAVLLTGVLGGLHADHIPCNEMGAHDATFNVGIPAAIIYDGADNRLPPLVPVAELPPLTLPLYRIQQAYLEAPR